MIKYCLLKWEANKEKLRTALKTEKCWNDCSYLYLVMSIVKNILNPSIEGHYEHDWDDSDVTEIDDGDYQGTLLFLIHKDTYQPSAQDYLITFIEYGSCSCCDTLQRIQSDSDGEYLTERQIEDFMLLSKEIVMNMKKPFNNGWRNDDIYDEIEVKNKDVQMQ